MGISSPEDLSRAVAQLSSVESQKDRIEGLCEIGNGIVGKLAKSDDNSSGQLVRILVSHLLEPTVPAAVAKPVLHHFSGSLVTILSGEDESEAALATRESVCRAAECVLSVLKTRLVTYDEDDAFLREGVAAYLENCGEYSEAAKTLSRINMDCGKYTDDQKAAAYVHIAELFLEEDDSVEAERFNNRASQFIHGSKDQVVKTKYRVSHARILDAKRKFLDASIKYYSLSVNAFLSSADEEEKEEAEESMHVVEDDVHQLLVCAVTCAVLAKAGPQRSRMLGTLYRDERVRRMGGVKKIHWHVLRQMYTERLIKSSEVNDFEASLLPHQKATLADGSTVLERAMIEHNMLAASRIYKNIRFEELGALLGTSAANAEEICARMIREGRMQGTIDGVDGVLSFEIKSASSDAAAFDARVQSFCNELNTFVERLEEKHPKYRCD